MEGAKNPSNLRTIPYVMQNASKHMYGQKAQIPGFQMI
jgi:hypothetical protein